MNTCERTVPAQNQPQGRLQFLTGLLTTLLLFTALPGRAQVSELVDPNQTWTGYLNWYHITGAAYLGGTATNTATLRAYFTPDAATATRLLIQMNTNTYAPNTVWNGPDGSSLRMLEADFYVDTGTTYDGQTMTFSGMCESNTLPASMQIYAFVKEFTPNYASVLANTTVALVSGTPFSITSPAPIVAGDIAQYGFYTFGPNTAPNSADAKQAVSVLVTNAPHVPVTVGIDPAQTWNGYLNFSSTSDSYIGGNGYSIDRCPAVFVPSQAGATRLLLGINTDTYDAGTTNVFDTAGGAPSRHLETDSYVDAGPAYGGDTLTFQGTIESNSLPAGWTAYCVIKEFTSTYGYVGATPVALGTSGAFTVSRNIATGGNAQYGFYVYGPNTAPGSANSKQHVSLIIGSSVTAVSVAASVTGTTVHLSFPTQNGVTYTVYYKNHLSDANWVQLGSTVPGTGGTATPTDTLGGKGAMKYYRVSGQ